MQEKLNAVFMLMFYNALLGFAYFNADQSLAGLIVTMLLGNISGIAFQKLLDEKYE